MSGLVHHNIHVQYHVRIMHLIYRRHACPGTDLALRCLVNAPDSEKALPHKSHLYGRSSKKY